MLQLRAGSCFVRVAAGWSLAMAAAMHSVAAGAQSPVETYPAKPVRIIVPLAIGGGTDIMARMLATRLSAILQRQFVVENRLGAGGTIAFGTIAKSPPDGYTLLVTGSGFATTPALHANLSYDPINDFSPITLIYRTPYLLVVHPSLPVKSVRELIALAKARPGMITFGSSGHGSGVHFAEELFRSMARVNMVHVPYKGAGDAEIDLVAGRIQMMTGGMISALKHVRNGRLRLLAVTTATRSATLPDVATIAESGVPGYEAVSWGGMLGPQGMRSEVIFKLYNVVADVVREPEIVKRMLDDGSEAVASKPDEFRQFLVADIARNRKTAKDAGLSTNAGN